MEGNLRFKIVWATLTSGRNVLLCFTLYLRAISTYKPPGGLSSEGRFNGVFFALRVGEVYIWRGLFSEFYGMPTILLIFELLVDAMFLVISTPRRIQYYPYI